VSTDTTRERVLSLIASAGPITAGALADKLGLTPAAVRRHLGALTDDGFIADYEVPTLADRGRGRPATSFVATSVGQRTLQSAYSDVARDAVSYLRDRGDLSDFVEAHAARLEASWLGAVDPNAPIVERVEALSEALAAQGYATSVRPGPGGHTVQLCQGHCPVQEVAQVAPEWCEAEARAFSSVLGVHVQRLSTLAQGAHVCTTTIPLSPALKEG
jgi:predicted ArsR family transcriptional regulator